MFGSFADSDIAPISPNCPGDIPMIDAGAPIIAPPSDIGAACGAGETIGPAPGGRICGAAGGPTGCGIFDAPIAKGGEGGAPKLPRGPVPNIPARIAAMLAASFAFSCGVMLCNEAA
jgi:hypothetical protein